jgi:hypothetical protein
MTTTPPNGASAVAATTGTEQNKRSRRAEPINTHTAKNGAVSYWFQIDVGTKPDGSRDRRKFSYPTKAEARKALRRISSEVAAGTYSKPTTITVSEACDEWLAGRRGIRRVTLYSYEKRFEARAAVPRREAATAVDQGRWRQLGQMDAHRSTHVAQALPA